MSGGGPTQSTAGELVHTAPEDARALMGDDFWPYGLEPNRNVLDTFLRYHHEQGCSSRRFTPDELFAPETLVD